MEELTKYLNALLRLQVAAMYPADPQTKPEVLLKKSGFKYQEIADILGKNEAAIAKSVSRAK